MGEIDGESVGNQSVSDAAWRRKKQRPHIRPPLTMLEIVAIAITITGLLFTVMPLALWWPGIPDTIPTHFDIYGQPNAYGTKATLLIYPGIALGITLLFQGLCRFPWIFNYPVRITEENALRQYRRGRLLLRWVNAVVLLLGGLQWQALQVARGAATSLGATYSLSAFILLAPIIPAGIIALVIIWARWGK